MIKIKPIKEPSAELSPAEKRVYDQMILGLNNKEIANAICKTERTVKFHSENIFRKLGINNRCKVIANHYLQQLSCI